MTTIIILIGLFWLCKYSFSRSSEEIKYETKDTPYIFKDGDEWNDEHN